MKSIRELYRIGTGPSSSHTMGPRKAAEIFLGNIPKPKLFKLLFMEASPLPVKDT